MGEAKKRLFLLMALCLILGMFVNVRFNGPQRGGQGSGAPRLSKIAKGTEQQEAHQPTCPPAKIVYVEKEVPHKGRDKDAEDEIGNHPGEDQKPTPQPKQSERGDAAAIVDVPNDMLNDVNQGVMSPQGSNSGVRTFTDKCLFPDSDRVVFFPREKAIEKATAWVAKRREQGGSKNTDSLVVHSFPSTLAPAFVVRDVCALGHFPKDLAHYYNWVHMERRRRNLKSEGGEENSDEFEDGILSLVILGNRCASKDPSKITNKRTPTFRDVLRGWVDAITQHSVVAEAEASSAKLLDLGKGDADAKDKSRRFFLFYADVVTLLEGSAARPPTLMCFPTMHEREESWRWFPSAPVADGFRQRLWAPLGLNDEYAKMQLDLHKKHFDSQRKLQVLVLRRDEDRHFNEGAAAKFLEEKFGKVARIVFTQFDKPPAKHLTAETNITVASFTEQSKALFQTDVLVAAHGAALSSIVYMRPGSVVLELFPHNFRYYMYEELSRVLSLRYEGFEGTVVSPPKCCTARSLGLKEIGTGGGGAAENNAKDGGKYFPVQRDEKSVMKTAGELLSGRLNNKDDVKTTKERKDGGGLEVVGSESTNIKMVKEFNGLRDCKKCDIYVTQPEWYYLIKNALSSLWLQNSRLSNVHHFDIRR